MPLVLFIAVVALAVFLDRRYPVGPLPRYVWRSWIPRVLRTGAVTFGGFCFVLRSFIVGEHRAHEQYHHNRVRELGRIWHLVRYLGLFVAGLLRHGFTRYTSFSGRTYLMAYWWHPEEVAARAYGAAMAAEYGTLGSPT